MINPMIHNTSKAPVLIKKIPLKVWRLKSEIKSVVKRRLQIVKDPGEFELTDLAQEYQRSDEVASDNDELPPMEGEDTGEDEMAKAIAQAEAEENGEIISEDISDDNENIIDQVTGNQIIQRRPNLNSKETFVGRSILGEISMDNMYLFCNEEFLQGESIVIDFLIPNCFILNAEVVFCRTYNMRSRIIGANRLPYRVGIKFTFLKPGERTLLRKFILSIEPDVVLEPEKTKAVSNDDDDDDDDFGDLDDLDL